MSRRGSGGNKTETSPPKWKPTGFRSAPIRRKVEESSDEEDAPTEAPNRTRTPQEKHILTGLISSPIDKKAKEDTASDSFGGIKSTLFRRKTEESEGVASSDWTDARGSQYSSSSSCTGSDGKSDGSDGSNSSDDDSNESSCTDSDNENWIDFEDAKNTVLEAQKSGKRLSMDQAYQEIKRQRARASKRDETLPKQKPAAKVDKARKQEQIRAKQNKTPIRKDKAAEASEQEQIRTKQKRTPARKGSSSSSSSTSSDGNNDDDSSDGTEDSNESVEADVWEDLNEAKNKVEEAEKSGGKKLSIKEVHLGLKEQNGKVKEVLTMLKPTSKVGKSNKQEQNTTKQKRTPVRRKGKAAKASKQEKIIANQRRTPGRKSKVEEKRGSSANKTDAFPAKRKTTGFRSAPVRTKVEKSKDEEVVPNRSKTSREKYIPTGLRSAPTDKKAKEGRAIGSFGGVESGQESEGIATNRDEKENLVNKNVLIPRGRSPMKTVIEKVKPRLYRPTAQLPEKTKMMIAERMEMERDAALKKAKAEGKQLEDEGLDTRAKAYKWRLKVLKAQGFLERTAREEMAYHMQKAENDAEQMRKKVIEMIEKAFLMHEGGEEDDDEYLELIANRAKEIEHAVTQANWVYPGPWITHHKYKTSNYKNVVRLIAGSLGKRSNEKLRLQVLGGAISVDELARMTPDELYTPEERAEKEKEEMKAEELKIMNEVVKLKKTKKEVNKAAVEVKAERGRRKRRVKV